MSSKKSGQSEDSSKARQNSVEFTSEKRKTSIVAVLNQGLANLGERLCKCNWVQTNVSEILILTNVCLRTYSLDNYVFSSMQLVKEVKVHLAPLPITWAMVIL